MAASEEIKRLVEEVEGALSGIEKKQIEMDGEYEKVKRDAKAVRAQRDESEAKDKRRIEGLHTEMASLGNRLERLNVRKEKLEGEGGVLSELEERLRKLEEERERVENDPLGDGYSFDDGDSSQEIRRGSIGSLHTDDSSPMGFPPHPLQPPQRGPHTHTHHSRNHSPHHLPNNHHHHPRKRHSHPRGPIPIQRPSHNSRPSFPPVPGIIHLNMNPHANSHKIHHSSSGSGSLSSSINLPSAQPSSTVLTSNLSSKAPAFEPSSRRRGQSGSVSSVVVGGSNGTRTTTTPKSDLNPGSSPFSPRLGVSIAANQAASVQPPIGATVGMKAATK